MMASLYIFLACIGSSIVGSPFQTLFRRWKIWFTHAPKYTDFKQHKIDGTRPNSLAALVDESENCWSIT